MRRLLLAAAALALLADAAHPQIDPATEAAVDAIFLDHDRPGSPGAAVGVVRGGCLVFARGYGSAQIEYGVPITPRTPFHVASEAKQFTAFCVLLLAKRGVLTLEDDVRRWLPEVPDFGATIRIRHLLDHASGLRDQWQALALAGRYGADVVTTAHVLRWVSRQARLNFAPGTKELYCNTGYTLLAEIVARASGRSFADFARDEIFRPLGMTDTRFQEDPRRPIPGRAESYAPAPDGAFERRPLEYGVPGPTSLLTTVEDMAKWLANFEDPLVGDPELLACLETRDELDAGGEVLWGKGLHVDEYRGTLRVGHGGADAGFRAYSARFPEHGLGVVVLANLSSIEPGPFGDALAMKVADLFLPTPVDAVRAPDEVGAEVEIVQYVGSYALEDGHIVDLTDDYGRLTLREHGGERSLALEPVSAGEFRVRSDSIERVLFAGPGGRIDRLRLEGSSAVTDGSRIDAVPPEGLESFAGCYYSDELETSWRLAVAEGGLVARHSMHADVPLRPVVRDLFEGGAWFLGRVRILRAADGSVTGMTVSAGRIYDVGFRRIGD